MDVHIVVAADSGLSMNKYEDSVSDTRLLCTMLLSVLDLNVSLLFDLVASLLVLVNIRVPVEDVDDDALINFV